MPTILANPRTPTSATIVENKGFLVMLRIETNDIEHFLRDAARLCRHIGERNNFYNTIRAHPGEIS